MLLTERRGQEVVKFLRGRAYYVDGGGCLRPLCRILCALLLLVIKIVVHGNGLLLIGGESEVHTEAFESSMFF